MDCEDENYEELPSETERFSASPIMNAYLEREKQFDTTNFLDGHQVTEGSRAKFLNWLRTVLNAFECEEEVFFKTVAIMDLYYKLTTRVLANDALMLVGVTALHLASKVVQERSRVVKIHSLVEYVVGGRYTVE
jgi:hypothetical protein